MDMNEQIILTIWNTINKVPLNKTYFVIGTPDQIEKSYKYSAAVNRFGISDDDSVFLIYDAGVLRTCIKGMAVSLSGVYMRGFDPHHWYWPDFINMDIRCDGSKIYIGRDEEVGGTPDVEKFAACLIELQNKLRPIFTGETPEPTNSVTPKRQFSRSLSEIATNAFLNNFKDIRLLGSQVYGISESNGRIVDNFTQRVLNRVGENFFEDFSRTNLYDDDSLLFVFDYRSGLKEGLIITDNNILWNFSDGKKYYSLRQIISAEKRSFFLADCIVLHTAGGTIADRIFLTGIKNPDKFVAWFNAFLQEVQRELH